MRKLKLLILGLVAGLAVCGCEKREAAAEQEEKEKEVAMGITVKWLGHASFKICGDEAVIYIDPWKLSEAAHDATLVLVSHSHSDHYSAEDVAKASGPDTKLIAPGDVIKKAGRGQVIKAGQTIEAGDVNISGVASYNPNKRFHPKANNWVGFVIKVGSVRIYYAGDTDLTDEMKALRDIDVALLPVGGKYTMDASEAAEAVSHIKPKEAIPYHWGDIIGSAADAKQFAEKAECKVTVLQPGEMVSFGD